MTTPKSVPQPDPDIKGVVKAARGFLELGHAKEALILCENVLQQEPGDADAHWLAGQSLMALDRPDDAVPHLQQVSRALPKRGLPLVDLSLALDQAGRTKEALSVAADAAAREPGLAACWHELGRLSQKLGDHATAVKSLDEYLKIRPKDPDALLLRGISKLGLGRQDEAAADLREAIERAPDLKPRAQRLVAGRLSL